MKSADDRYKPKSCCFSKEWLFLQAFLTALALNTELGVADDEIDGISNVLLARLYALFAQIEFGIRSRGFFLTVLTAALFVGYMWISQKKRSQYSTACRDVLFLPSCDRGDALHAA